MGFSGFLAVSALLAQLSAPHDRAAPQPGTSGGAGRTAIWQGGGVARCPENLRFEGRTLRLTEVPETATHHAETTAVMRGRALRAPAADGSPAPCVAPAGR